MRRPPWLALAAVALTACGGRDSTRPISVDVVEIAPGSLSLHPGDTARLIATTKSAQGATLTNRTVTWSSSNEMIATVSTTGLVTAIAFGSPVTMTAASEGKSGTATVTVTPVPVAAIVLSPVTITLEAGDTTRITATVRGAGGQTLTNRTVTWSSSSPGIASVTNAGLVTGVAPGGPVNISATSEGIIANMSVTVIPAAIASLSVAPPSPSIILGSQLQLVATLRDARGNALIGRAVAWTSAAPSIVSVSGAGVVTGVTVGGPVAITASSEGIQAVALVSVRDVPVARVEVSAPNADLNEGATLQLAVRLTDSGGNTLTGRTVTWTSDSTHIATVNGAGLVQTVRAGVARIRARAEGIDGTLDITIRGLLHRWTFDEQGGAGTTFRDDLRGAHATIVQGGTLDASAVAGQVTLTGGARANADYVALPAGLLRSRTDATIEVWATVHSLRNWSRVFDIGSGTSNYLFIAWSQGTNALADRAAFNTGTGEDRVDNSLAPFTRDVQHHIVMSIDEGGGAVGRTRVSLFLDGAPRGSFETTYRLRDLVDNDFWLGRSHYGDETANASYDEVRIHDRVYPPAEVRQIFLRGPVRSGPPANISILPPAGMRDTVRGVGVRFQLRAIGRDALGRQFPLAGAQWTSSNPSVASIDAAGAVHALTAGRSEIEVRLGTTTARWTAEVVRMRRVTVDPYLATPIAGALWEVPVVLIEYLPSADGAGLDVTKTTSTRSAPCRWTRPRR